MTTLPGRHESLWTATGPRRAYGRQEGDLETDVAVVDGGITGLTTALLLKEAGLRVLVLEARHLGAGTTGRTTGKVTSQHHVTYHPLASLFGENTARIYGEANQAAIREVHRLGTKYGVDADLHETDAYVYTQAEDGVPTLQQEAEAARRAGLPASFVERVAFPLPVRGAMRFSRQAQLHPMKYLHGLAEAIHDGGSQVLEHTRVLDLQDDDGVGLRTEHGRVRARSAVVATLLPVFSRGFEFAKARPTRSYGIAARVPEQQFEEMFISLESPTRSLRHRVGRDGATDLVVVGESHETGHGEGLDKHYEALVSLAREHFPVESVEYRWSAQDYRSVDGLPYVGRLNFTSHVQVAAGFKKWGLTNGTVAARLMTDAILGWENPWADVFDANRGEPHESTRKLIEENLHVARTFVKERVRGDTPRLDDIPDGQGDVIEMGGEHVAVSKDARGVTTAVSAVCSHMGCLVHWNDAETTWDCPCHGSRFDARGEVVDGPATRALEPREV